jgi:hypothetical protein
MGLLLGWFIIFRPVQFAWNTPPPYSVFSLDQYFSVWLDAKPQQQRMVSVLRESGTHGKASNEALSICGGDFAEDSGGGGNSIRRFFHCSAASSAAWRRHYAL